MVSVFGFYPNLCHCVEQLDENAAQSLVSVDFMVSRLNFDI